jgi:hypothetical protein
MNDSMRVASLVTVMLVWSISLFAAESPFSGTWRLNPAKGHPIQPLPRSAVVHIEVDGDNFNFNQEYVARNGRTINIAYHAKFDGQEYSVMGDPNAETVSLRRMNDRNVHFTFKKSGKLALTMDAVVSKDAETITLTYSDYSEGKPHNGSAVYERQ